MCLASVQQKLDQSTRYLNDLKESSATETKSSAGDKFETSREMMQQEIDKAELHFSKLSQQLLQLKSMTPEERPGAIDNGSFVITNRGSFYISAALGKIKFENEFFFAISIESPMARALRDKLKGDKVFVSGRDVIVEDVY